MSVEAQVVELRDKENLQWTQIGDRLGISRDAARRAYSRGQIVAPDANCFTLPNGECASPKDCIHGPGVNEADVAVRKGDFRRWAKKANWPSILEQLKDGILEDIRAESYSPAPHDFQYTDDADVADNGGLLLEIAPVDVHFGKLSWQDETGVNYDVTIAESVFKERIEGIITDACRFPLARIVIVVGNDALQTDNLAGTTTAGTFVDTDTRYIRSFRRCRRAHSWAIRRLAEIAPVHVIVVPGNHDRLTAFHLGEVLAAEFQDHPTVVIDASPRLRKYFRFGVNLLGFTHGSEEKVSDLPLLMAQECPDDWAKTTWREWHTGHLHKVREMRFTAADEFNGVRVRTLPALCPPDAWHYQRGFTGSQKATEAFLWHPVTGYKGHLSSNFSPPPQQEVAA